MESAREERSKRREIRVWPGNFFLFFLENLNNSNNKKKRKRTPGSLFFLSLALIINSHGTDTSTKWLCGFE